MMERKLSDTQIATAPFLGGFGGLGARRAAHGGVERLTCEYVSSSVCIVKPTGT